MAVPQTQEADALRLLLAAMSGHDLALPLAVFIRDTPSATLIATPSGQLSDGQKALKTIAQRNSSLYNDLSTALKDNSDIGGIQRQKAVSDRLKSSFSSFSALFKLVWDENGWGGLPDHPGAKTLKDLTP